MQSMIDMIVRQYQNQPLSKEVIHALQSEIDACNQERDCIFNW